MIVFYRPRKWMLPVLASQNDLLLLDQILKYQPKDLKSERKQRGLVFAFHQMNYIAGLGSRGHYQFVKSIQMQ
jgi:hypothetical protein